MYLCMSLLSFSLLLFVFLFLLFSLLLFFLLQDDGAVVVEASLCGPVDVSEHIAVNQLARVRLLNMIGCPVIMGIGIDRVDGPSRRSAGSSSAIAWSGRRGHTAQDGVVSDIQWWAPWHGGAEATHPQTRPVRPAALSATATVRRL